MERKTIHHRRRGFTLIEILIVFALVGLLVGLGLPQYKYATKRAREATLKADLYEMRMLINQYYTDKGKYPLSLQTLVDEAYLYRIPIDPFTRSSETWIEVQQTITEDEMMMPEIEVGIMDVLSGSNEKAIDGTPYNSW